MLGSSVSPSPLSLRAGKPAAALGAPTSQGTYETVPGLVLTGWLESHARFSANTQRWGGGGPTILSGQGWDSALPLETDRCPTPRARCRGILPRRAWDLQALAVCAPYPGLVITTMGPQGAGIALSAPAPQAGGFLPTFAISFRCPRGVAVAGLGYMTLHDLPEAS